MSGRSKKLFATEKENIRLGDRKRGRILEGIQVQCVTVQGKKELVATFGTGLCGGSLSKIIPWGVSGSWSS